MTSREFRRIEIQWQDVAWVPEVEQAEVRQPWIAPTTSRYQHTLVSTGGHNLRRPVICVSQTKQRKTV